MDIPNEFKIGIIINCLLSWWSLPPMPSPYLVKGGDVALSVVLTSLTSVLSIFTIPIIVSTFIYFEIGDSVNFNLPFFKLLIQNVVFLLVPIIIGMILNYYSENFCKENIFSNKKLPNLSSAFVDYCFFFIENRGVITIIFSQLSIMITILVVSVMLVSYLVSLLFGIKLAQEKQ